MHRKHLLSLTLGGLFCALFFVSSNILPPITLIPSVPFTFQVMVLALTAGILGLRGGMLTLGAIFLLTLAGVPMMSGFGAGLGAFARPTGGFILGWVFLVLALGVYIDLAAPRLRAAVRGKTGRALHFAAFTGAGMAGVTLVYLCGAVFLALYNGAPHTAQPVFISTFLTYGILDGLKIVCAAVLAEAANAALRRTAGQRLHA